MSDIDDLLSRLPYGSLATQLGVDEDSARAAARQAVPALLAGLQTQTTDEEAAQKLVGALAQHDNDLATGEIDVDQVDTADGSKIVAHIFGDKTPEVAGAVSNQVPAAAVDPGVVQKLLPILAPIVLSYLTKKVLGGAGGGAPTQAGSGGLGDLLGTVLGGGKGGGAAGERGDLLGGMLGGAAGSGAKQGGGDLLGGILGSILGGKK
ncbi:hypothetical protein GP2_038_00380 [Gordonia paraffinivorans NBRC 108238]|uniref:DUF937 domain-containing protein n=1 Tax=Gordonia paraffinivorans NBRC 108238 TaxID=1223543 RepID=A0ABQ0IQ30_9ACTN|nr:DUF937 domain-containing protein [Gordonia paraffinivorans]GAC85662.1 hypothetical protein GP2_038_00380 [Gordonia paraffinivorans NBRC 108238]